MKKNGQTAILGEGILVGIIAGFIAALYRLALQFTGTALNYILNFIKHKPLLIAGWFVVLLVLAWMVGRLIAYETMISGSGLPHLEGEMTGELDLNWRKVIPAKFAAGFLCLFGGLALGRVGPSIQLGAMTGKGISQTFRHQKEEEKIFLTCGAGAGLAATFHAPLAGVIFSLEKIYKSFSAAVLVPVMAAAAAADLLASLIFSTEPIFTFDILYMLPIRYYWLLLILGAVLGILGVFYSWFVLKVQSLYNQSKHLNASSRLIIPFLCAGVLGFAAPELLGSGQSLITSLTQTDILLGSVLFIFIGRFVFSVLCFGSGAPGGIFFPLLMLGSYIGGVFAGAGVQFFGLDPIYVNNFILLAMAGYFSAVIHAPLTGVILLFEMSGSPNQLLSLAIVSVTAYIVSSLLKPESLNDCLLERILKKRKL